MFRRFQLDRKPRHSYNLPTNWRDHQHGLYGPDPRQEIGDPECSGVYCSAGTDLHRPARSPTCSTCWSRLLSAALSPCQCIQHQCCFTTPCDTPQTCLTDAMAANAQAAVKDNEGKESTTICFEWTLRGLANVFESRCACHSVPSRLQTPTMLQQGRVQVQGHQVA